MTTVRGICALSTHSKERAPTECAMMRPSSGLSLQNNEGTVWGAMPKRLGRFQRQLLEELEIASNPLRTSALMQGRSGFEKRRALRRLVAEGFVSEVRPDTWRLNNQARVRKRG